MNPPSSPRRTRFASTDPDRTEEYVERNYGWRLTSQRLTDEARPGRGGDHRGVVIEMSDAGAFTRARADALGTEISYRVTGGDYVVVNTLLEGQFELECPTGVERYGPGDVFIANHPGADFASRTRDIVVLNTILPTALLEGVAGEHLPHPQATAPPLRFTSRAAHRDARRWRAVSRFAEDLLQDVEASTAPMLVAAAARQLAAVVLVTFPNTAAADLFAKAPTDARDHHDAHPATLRRAVAFIEEKLDEDVTTADIARAARVTPRALQLSFRRHLDTTPLAHLRRVRLEHARQDLQAATPGDGQSVTAIVRRWGFTSTRFTQQYRAAYGELPAQTLRR